MIDTPTTIDTCARDCIPELKYKSTIVTQNSGVVVYLIVCVRHINVSVHDNIYTLGLTCLQHDGYTVLVDLYLP